MPRYTATAMAFHWVIAILLVANVLLGLTAESFPDAGIRPMIDAHKSLGITVLGLVVLRILWRWRHAPPAMPASYAGWERIASHIAHWTLYALMLALPLSGWLHDSAWKDAPAHPMSLFGLVPWPRIAAIANMPPVPKEAFHSQWFAIHQWLAYALYGLVALHLAGALKHQWLDREPEVQRMWPEA